MKATDEEYLFHSRMLNPDDLTAFAELSEWIYGILVRKTNSQAGTSADPVLIEEAVATALLEYYDNPHRYDPYGSSLLGYLGMAAYRDFLNAYTKEKRRTIAPLTNQAGVEFEIIDETQDIQRLFQRLEVEELVQAIAESFPNPVDRQIVDLLLDGERNYEPYAKALAINHLPQQEQNREVKRAKDRIAKRLQRIGRKFYER